MAEMTVEEARKQGAPSALLEEYEYAVAQGWRTECMHSKYSYGNGGAGGTQWTLSVWNAGLVWYKLWDFPNAARNRQSAWSAYTVRGDSKLTYLQWARNADKGALVGTLPRKSDRLADIAQHADWFAAETTKIRAEKRAEADAKLAKAQEKHRTDTEAWA